MQTLAAIPFLRSATDLDLRAYEAKCLWRRFEEGQVAVDYEDLSDDVYFIVSGDVRILVRTTGGKEVILSDMHSGQFFGELAAIDGVPRSANVTALTRADMCIVPGAVFRAMVYGSRALTEALMQLLSGRVRALNGRLVEHTVLDVRHRLFAELLRLSQPRHGHDGERIVTPPPFHHVLAGRVGCRREQISREVGMMIATGLAEKLKGGLVLKRPADLAARIETAMREAD